MTGLIEDVMITTVMLFMAAVGLAVLFGVPAAVVAVAGRVAGVW